MLFIENIIGYTIEMIVDQNRFLPANRQVIVLFTGFHIIFYLFHCETIVQGTNKNMSISEW